jgi:hypothetical protein
VLTSIRTGGACVRRTPRTHQSAEPIIRRKRACRTSVIEKELEKVRRQGSRFSEISGSSATTRGEAHAIPPVRPPSRSSRDWKVPRQTAGGTSVSATIGNLVTGSRAGQSRL